MDKDIKSLKRQLRAAIAMVLVAAVALGSSTYAWFVSNNQVEATTTSISAQSSSAFMTIENGATGAKNSDKTSVVSVLKDGEGNLLTKVPLYPATFGEESGSTKGKFMSGYGTALNDGTLNTTLTTVGTNGTPDEADTAEYALKEQFNISSKSNDMSDLRVESVVTATAADSEQLLSTAFRVLVTNSDASMWVVYGLNPDSTAYEIKLSSAESNDDVTLGDVIVGEDTLVNVYLYYEGSDENIHTNNLQNGKLAASQNVTITFTATVSTN